MAERWYNESMLYIRSLTATERGLLRQRQRTTPAHLASRWLGSSRHRTADRMLPTDGSQMASCLPATGIDRFAGQASRPSCPRRIPASSFRHPFIYGGMFASCPGHRPHCAGNSSLAQSPGLASKPHARAGLALVGLSALQTSPRQTKPLPQARGHATSLSTTAVVVLRRSQPQWRLKLVLIMGRSRYSRINKAGNGNE